MCIVFLFSRPGKVLFKTWKVFAIVLSTFIVQSAFGMNCGCPDLDVAQTRQGNTQFVERHIARLRTDIERLSSRSAASGTARRGWQRSADQELVQQKREIIQRLQGYQNRIQSLPNVRLTLSDLYADFRQGDCDNPQASRRPRLALDLFRQGSPPKALGRAPPIQSSEPSLDELRQAFSQEELGRCSPIDSDDLACSNSDAQVTTRENQRFPPAAQDCNCRSESPLSTLSRALSNYRGCGDTVICVNSRNEFLQQFQIPTNRPRGLASERDLSSWYSPPPFQGTTAACVGFATAADIEAELYRKSLGGIEIPPPDPWSTYRTMLGERGQACQGRTEGVSYGRTLEPRIGLRELARTELCLTEGTPARVAVESSVSLENTDSVDFSFFQQLIDHDRPVTVSISTERREILEDWMKPTQGGTPHVVTVVGYGHAINPQTLCNEPLTIRHSVRKRELAKPTIC